MFDGHLVIKVTADMAEFLMLAALDNNQGVAGLTGNIESPANVLESKAVGAA